MKKTEKFNIDAVAMVRKIRDENYKRCRGMSTEEKIAYIKNKAQQANRKLNVSPEKVAADRKLVHA